MTRRASSLLALALGALTAACRGPATAPTVQAEIEMVFVGKRSIDEERLRGVILSELSRLEATRPSKAAIDDAAFALELFYRARGFAFARVDYEHRDEPGEAVRAHFHIEEGEQVRVRELRLEGVSAFDPAVARAQFGSAARGGIYDADRLEAAASKLNERYLDEGFLHASVSSPEVEFSEDRRAAVVSVKVVEGPCFRVTEALVAGAAPELAQDEQLFAAKFVEKPFGPGVELDLRSRIQEDHARRGYPDCQTTVEAELDEESGAVRLAVRVEPGPLVRIAQVRSQGNVRTREKTIRARLGIEPGEIYDSEKVRQGFRELYKTGLFESIRVEPVGEGAERDLLVTVVESRFVEVRAEPGWGSYEGPRLRAVIQDKNFRGHAQRLSLEGTISPLSQSGRIGLLDPAILGSNFTAETSFFTERREEPSFEFTRIGASFFLRRQWTEDWSSSFGYEYRPTEVTEDELQSPAPLPLDDVLPSGLTNDADVGSLSIGVVHDDRDNPLLPTRGRRARASLEWADDGLGSKVEFLRGQLEYTQLFRLPRESSLAASARTGLIAPFGTTVQIPLPERFFNGGENSVRSFREDELGPTDLSGEPIGGESATTLNLELRRPIVGNLAGALFVDAGNVEVDFQDYFRFDDLRYGVGLGLRYLLPIGPLRVDFAVNPDPRDGEDDYVLHFSVGFPY